VDDNLTTNFLNLLNKLPLFPLYYEGRTKFAPIHCSDVTDTIHYVLSKNIYSNIIECVGPEIITFKELLKRLLKLIDKKRILIPFPLFLAQFTARVFELMPNPLLTRDQLRLLKYNNIATGKYKTNSDIGIPSVKFFDKEVKKYCFMWKDGGQYSKDEYKSKDNS
jgi:NADH dehydrogenase